jgi:guanosine-3',5'-bis(diphosphate) 3'-pyrophosphohydrolase
MSIVLKAISFAAERHHGQMRKNKRTPYFAHPVRVMLNVLREFGESDPETLAAAVLHDTIEDTTTDYDDILRHFGDNVARWVALLTKDKRMAEEAREDDYFAGLARAPRPVKLVKISDTLDNLRDARAGDGDLKKTIAKAERLFAVYGGDPEVKHALDVLRAEAAR